MTKKVSCIAGECVRHSLGGACVRSFFEIDISHFSSWDR
jgi:hypothetical protein